MRGTAKSRQAKPRVDALRLLAQRDALEAIARTPGPLAQLAAIRLRVIRFVLRRYKPNLADIGPAVPFDVVRAELQTEFDARESPRMADTAAESLDVELPRTRAPHREASTLVEIGPKLEKLRDVHAEVGHIQIEHDARVVDRRRIESMSADVVQRLLLARLAADGRGGPATGLPVLAQIPSLVASGMATRRGSAIRWLAMIVVTLAGFVFGRSLAELSPGISSWLGGAGAAIVALFFVGAAAMCITPEVWQGGITWGPFKVGWGEVERAHLDDAEGILRIHVTRRTPPRDGLNSQSFTVTLDRFDRKPKPLHRWADSLAWSMRSCGVNVTTSWKNAD